MVVSTEKYDQLKIERLKQMLEDAAEGGSPDHYEIYVDGLRVVKKTNDPLRFDKYEQYVNEDTEKIRVVIYGASPSDRKGKEYVFNRKENAEQKPLQGLDIDARITEQVSRAREQWELEQLKQKLVDKEQSLQEAEDYIEKLQTLLAESKGKGKQEGTLGEIVTLVKDVAPYFMSSKKTETPALGGSGEEKKPQGEASFKKKEEAVYDEEQAYRQFIQEMVEKFDQEDLNKVISIIRKLETNPSLIESIIELLNKQNKNNENL